MRTKIFIFIVFIFSHIACDKSVNPIIKDEIYVTKFNIEGMRKKHLSNFELVSKQARREGREFVFDNLNDTTNLFIRVGIHSSKAKAQYIAEDVHSWFMIIPQEDSMKVLGIGDRCWWMPAPLSPDTVTYLFIRHNSYIIVNSHTYPDLLELTRAIDMDIVNNADYVDLENSISLPKIHLITATKTELKEGETCKITVNASDPHNEPLDYIVIFGLGLAGDLKNVFLFQAFRDNVPEPFWGSHILKFTVINESNVVSETAELKITISQ